MSRKQRTLDYKKKMPLSSNIESRHLSVKGSRCNMKRVKNLTCNKPCENIGNIFQPSICFQICSVSIIFCATLRVNYMTFQQLRYFSLKFIPLRKYSRSVSHTLSGFVLREIDFLISLSILARYVLLKLILKPVLPHF